MQVVADPEEITPLQRMLSGGLAGAVAQVRRQGCAALGLGRRQQLGTEGLFAAH